MPMKLGNFPQNFNPERSQRSRKIPKDSYHDNLERQYKNATDVAEKVFNDSINNMDHL